MVSLCVLREQEDVDAQVVVALQELVGKKLVVDEELVNTVTRLKLEDCVFV